MSGWRAAIAGAIIAIAVAAAWAAILRDDSGEELPCQTASANCAADPSPSPDPGGDETARLKLPPDDGLLFGFNESPSVDGLGSPALEQLAATAGANARRFTVDWRAVEPIRNQWDEGGWGYYLRAYEAIVAAEMQPVISFGFAPQWARESGAPQACSDFFACRFPPSRAMDGEWRRFAAEVARRFPRAVLEVWNEPNLSIFWRSGPDPERLAELQALAFDEIRAVDPAIVVLAGGLAINQAPGHPVAPVTPGDIPLREFLDRAYSAQPSIAGHMDAISFHPYPYGLHLGAGSVFADSFADVRAVTTAHGDTGRPLWVTETGIASEGSFAVSEEEQADLISRLVRRLATMPDVKAILLHRLLPPPTEGPGSTERGYALLRAISAAPEPKPAYCTLAALAGTEYERCPG